MITVYCLGVLSGVAGMLVIQHGWGWVLSKFNTAGKL